MRHVFLIVVAVLLLTSVSSCAASYQDRSFDVSPLSNTHTTVTMSKGKVLEGYLTVRGGNDDIRFYIKDSYGNKVLDIEVKGRYDFSYTAISEGFHTLYFDNSFSLFTGKQVLMHYRVR